MDQRTSILEKEDHFEVLPTVQIGDNGSGVEVKVIWIYEFEELRLDVDYPLGC